MKWISVKERLPELGIEVLISNRLYGRGIGYCINPSGSFQCTILGTSFTEEEPNVTHWMPLPEAPTE